MSAATPEPPLDLTAIAVRALMLYSLAEFQAGHVTTIRVTAEGTAFSIADDGRGHPIDRTLEGTPYVTFIYTHFDYPFESGRSAPIQLQGIGMSMVNALCSELSLTVRKRDETLHLVFRDGQLHSRDRMAKPSTETGITVAASIKPQLQSAAAGTRQIQEWLQGVLAVSPSLRLFFNGVELQAPSPGAA